MPKRPSVSPRQQTSDPDLGQLLRKRGHWYGSMKVQLEGQWLIAFCYGMILSTQDAQVEHTALDETMTQRLLLSWQIWCTAPNAEPLSFTGKYETVQSGPIKLRQFQTEAGHPVYLMESLCTYLPEGEWSYLYLPAKHAVLIKAPDATPRALFTELVPRLPIQPIGSSPRDYI